MAQYPNGYDPETEEFEVDQDGTRIYRPRKPGAQSPSSSATPTAPPPSSTTAAQAPGSFDPSRIYQPRYIEERPNNFGSALAGATRRGSVLNILGSVFGGGNYEGAQKYNEAEHRKFEDSVKLEELRQQGVRWDAYTKGQNKPARVPAKLALAQALQDGEFDDDQDLKKALMQSLAGGRQSAPTQRHGEDAAYDQYVEEEIAAGRKPESYLKFHERWTDNGRADPRPQQGQFTAFTDPSDGTTKLLNTKTGEVMPLKGAGGFQRPGPTPKPKTPFDPVKEQENLVKQYINQNGKAPDENAMRTIKATVAALARAGGNMPDQRAKAPAAKPQGQPIYATNPQTGERVVTYDGENWQPAPK